jgi:hypothetical protein
VLQTFCKNPVKTGFFCHFICYFFILLSVCLLNRRIFFKGIQVFFNNPESCWNYRCLLTPLIFDSRCYIPSPRDFLFILCNFAKSIEVISKSSSYSIMPLMGVPILGTLRNAVYIDLKITFMTINHNCWFIG